MRRLRLDDGWEVRPKVHRLAEMAGASAPWTAVTLPHDAMIGTTRVPEAGPATGYFPGGAWEYRRPLDLAVLGDRPAGGPVLLELEGVYRDAVVTVNGSVAGRRPSGYSQIVVPIDHLLATGGENQLHVDATSGDDSRWYAGAGIYRGTWLRWAGPIHLGAHGPAVRTPEVSAEGAVITVSDTVTNRSSHTVTLTLRIELTDRSGALVLNANAPVTVFAGESVDVHRRLHLARPQLWGPDHPELYRCHIALLDRETGDPLDEDTTTFGIRTVTVDPAHGLRINGDPVLLRGACIHHDNGPLGVASIERAEERRVELLQAAGFNALRSAHHPMSRALLDTCDRLGVLVMDETFDMWAQPKTGSDYARNFDEWWEADVEAMVRKDLNHPSVVLYSIGNEIADGSTATGIHRARGLAAKVRALDPSRPVTQAVSGLMVAGPRAVEAIRDVVARGGVDEETGVNTAMTNLGDLMNAAMTAPVIDEMTEEAFSHLDVAGYNYMEPRFDLDADLHPHRVIVASETHPGAIDTGWAGVVRHPQVIGDFTWTGWDYLGEAGVGRIVHGQEGDEVGPLGMSAFHGDYPWLTAWCGDLDITGFRRPQSYYREIVFGLRRDPYLAVQRPERHGRPVVHSSPWSWSEVVSSWTWPGHDGQPVTVEVYADADEVELLVNASSAGRHPAGPAHRYRAEFEVLYEPGVLEAVAWRDGAEVGRTRLTSASGPVRLRATADRATIVAGSTDLAFVELALVDDAGVVQNTADRLVTVAVDGPAVLQGLASARPATEEPFTGASVTTFDGRAIAVIRPTGEGSVTVRASADGCDPVAAALVVTPPPPGS